MPKTVSQNQTGTPAKAKTQDKSSVPPNGKASSLEMAASSFAAGFAKARDKSAELVNNLFEQRPKVVKEGANKSNVAEALVHQYFVTLESAYQTVDLAKAKSGPAAQAKQKIEKIIKASPAKRTWESANQFEQLLIPLLDEERLRTELLRRVDEAKRLKLPIADFYETRIKEEGLGLPEASTDANKVKFMRSLLARVTDDLQWHYRQHHLRRELMSTARQRVMWLFLFSLIGFILLLIVIEAKNTGDPKSQNVTQGANSTKVTDKPK